MKGNDRNETMNRMTRQVFYADAKWNRDVFANEWDKKNYLNAMEEAKTLLRIEIFAFCLLDDRIRLLAGGKDVKSRMVRRLVTAAMERFERDTELSGEANPVPAEMMIRANILRIEDEKDAMSVLRYIHLSPFSEGYTISAQDYWWTSYSTYRGHYNWTLLNPTPVMRYLSRFDSRASTTLAEYHRRGEALRNPVPSCIRKGEYETILRTGGQITQGNINETIMVHA